MLEKRSQGIRTQGRIASELLRVLYEYHSQNKGPLKTQDAYKILANRLHLTKAELEEKTESGENRWKAEVRAAKNNDLSKLGLMTHEKDGQWLITQEGIEKFLEEQKKIKQI